MLHTLAEAKQLRALIAQRRRYCQVAAALHDLLRTLLQQEAEVVVRGSVPWIRRNRRAVRRLRAVEVVWLWVATPPTAGATRTEPGAAAYTASDPDLGIPLSAQRYSWKLM